MLDRVVDTICANRDVWVAVMMAEEHELTPIDARASLRSAAVVGMASLAGALLPVAPFAFFPKLAATVAALVLGAAGLFALGAYEGSVTSRRFARSGLTLTAIGLTSATVGYIVGALAGR